MDIGAVREGVALGGGGCFGALALFDLIGIAGGLVWGVGGGDAFREGVPARGDAAERVSGERQEG